MLSFTSNAAAQLILWLQGLILKLLAGALFGAVKFFQWVVNFQSGAFNVTVVQELWRTMRDFANMFFILMMVFVALAAVLSLNKYDWRKLLPRIIVAAFLINFSYPICLLVIQFSQTLTNIALNLIGHDIAGNIGAALQLNKVNPLALGAGVGGAGATSAIAGTLISTVFITIMLAIALVSLITAGGFLFYRIPYLWGSIIFAPLAWTMGVFNAKIFDDWKKDFIAWTMFLPYYLFMLFIGLLVLSKRAAIESQLHLQTNADLTFLNFAFQDIFFYVFCIMVLVGSLKMAHKAAFASGTEASKAMNKVSGAVNQWAMNKSYLNALRKGFSQKTAEIKEKGLPGKPAWWKYGGERSEKLKEAQVAPVFGLVEKGEKRRLVDKYQTEDIEAIYKRIDAAKPITKSGLEERIKKAEGLEYLALAKMRAEKGWIADGQAGINEMERAITEAGENSKFVKDYLEAAGKNGFSSTFATIEDKKEALEQNKLSKKLRKALIKNMAQEGELFGTFGQDVILEMEKNAKNDSVEDKAKVQELIKKNFKNIYKTKKEMDEALSKVLADAAPDATPEIQKEVKENQQAWKDMQSALAEKMIADNKITNNKSYLRAVKILGGENDPRARDLLTKIERSNKILLAKIQLEAGKISREDYGAKLREAIKNSSPKAVGEADKEEFWGDKTFTDALGDYVAELEKKEGTTATREGVISKPGRGRRLLERITKEIEEDDDKSSKEDIMSEIERLRAQPTRVSKQKNKSGNRGGGNQQNSPESNPNRQPAGFVRPTPKTNPDNS